MKMKKKIRVSPFVQLLRLLQTDEQKVILIETIQPLKADYRDDFCLSCVAYIRFGIRRVFENRLMHILFTTYCCVLDHKS